MQSKKLKYLKKISEALKIYNKENETIDFQLVQKVYQYATNFDHLTPEELQTLDNFIEENSVNITHLATLYLDKKGKENLNNRLIRMLPIQITKPQSKIKLIKGKEKDLNNAIYQSHKVKVLCKSPKALKVA